MKHTMELPELPQEKPSQKPSFFKRLFRKKTERILKKTEKVEKKLEEKKEKKIEKKVTEAIKKKKEKKRIERKSLQQYLDKAGIDASAEKIKKRTFYITLTLFGIFTAWRLWQAALVGEAALETLIFTLSVWTVLFAAVMLIIYAGVYFFLDYLIYKRTREVEEVLPDFLQLASANIAAGMPIDRALWYSIRPSFGVLAKEMEEVAKATMAGENLDVSLVKFGQKYDSKILQRSISILIEGLNSGGELADLLNKIALNIGEIKIMKKEMAANVMTYAIFIIVAAVGIAPVLFALATQLLTIIVKITATLDLSSSQSFFSIGAVDEKIIQNFKYYSYGMLLVSSIFGASLVSIIRKGRVMEGIKEIPVYAILSIMIYILASKFFGGVFGGII